MKKVAFIFLTFFSSFRMMGQEVRRIKIGDLQKTIAESKTPLIINFWATFCKPCLEEIPYFQEVVKKHTGDGVKLLLISLDLEATYPAGIKKIIIERKLIAPVQWLDEFNADYFCPKVDSTWTGAIPSTLFVNNRTGYHKVFEDQLSREKFEKELMATLGKTD
jgi:thiol-disulfide isomerase/thioredoxin